MAAPGKRSSSPGAASGEAYQQPYTARLLVGCSDRPGIVAAVSSFLFEQGANIVSSQQYSTDPTGGRFFLRTEFFLPPAGAQARASAPLAPAGLEEGSPPRGSAGAVDTTDDMWSSLEDRFDAEVATRFAMDWQIRWWGQRRRIAILVSRHDHCLVELLWRWRRGELDADVVAVISNHPELEREALAVGVPYHHVPVETGREGQAEERMLALLEGNVDLLVSGFALLGVLAGGLDADGGIASGLAA
jgi:formyltetrahydrofolate deformylase